VPDPKSTILIVEDDLDIADMLNAYFRVQGYEVLTVNWGEDGVRACQNTPPDLVILDIRLPDIDGYEVARRLRSNRRTQDIPIIFLTERRERGDRLKGLELRAEDYITKPFDIQELRLRVRNALRRNTQGSLTNPITNLPEGALVDERLRECLEKQDWSLLLVSLQHIETFREKYGFVASDDLLRAVVLMLNDALREIGGPNDFLGHLSPTDFILVTDPATLPALKERVRKRLDQSLGYFYRDQDRQAEMVSENRLSIRTNELIPQNENFTDVEQIKNRLLQI
jgi:DNA-binding response OmpR family regulator